MTGFAIDRRLRDDTHVVSELALSTLLLMDDARFPWLILVPRVTGVRDLIDLEDRDQHLLLDEIAHVSRVLRKICQPDKLNVAALGNVVAQLHVHVIARFATDAAWPRPVWGIGEREGHSPEQLRMRAGELRDALAATAR